MEFDDAQLNALADDFVVAMSSAWQAVDLSAVAGNINILNADPLMARSWTRLHTLPMIQRARQMHLKPSEVVGLLHHNPSVIRWQMTPDLLMAKCARTGLDAYRDIFEFYMEVLTALCVEDPVARHYTNKIHTPAQAAELAAQCDSADADMARTLGRLANACLNLSYASYGDMNPQLGYDNFGPYDHDAGLFAIKIFPNLRPVELWPETADLPTNDIEVRVVLANVTLKVDSGTHAIYEGDQINGLRRAQCLFNGRPVTIDEIRDMTQRVQEKAISIYKKVKAMDTAQLKRLYCYQKAWGYKKLCDKLGMDWNPPAEVLTSMEGSQLFNIRIPTDEKQTRLFYEKLFDPRSELSSEIEMV